MQDVYDFLRHNETFYLATQEGDQPRVRPFGAFACFEQKLYLMTSNQKDVFRQLQNNPKLELCATGADGRWLRVSAKGILDERREAKAEMLRQNPSLGGMYSADDGKIAVFYLKDAIATFASFTESPRVVTF